MDLQHYEEGTPPGVLIRDAVLFHIKLLLDSFKDFAFFWLSLLAVLVDLLVGGPSRGKRFYAVLRMGERWDLWLNLNGAAAHAQGNPDGLFGESRAGDDTFLGEMEEMMRKESPAPGRALPTSPTSRPGIRR